MSQEGFCSLSVETFVSSLSSKEAVPGGGGAAALTGALAAALGEMVANLTIGKPKYAAVEEELLSLKAASSCLRKELLNLVEKDAEAFAPLAEAYRMAAQTGEEKDEKERVMQACLKQASLAPLEIMEKCGEAIALLEKFAEKGSVLAVSDSGCGAVLAKAALQAAWLNVRINVRLIKEKELAADIEARADAVLGKSLPLADKIYKLVEEKLR